MNDWKITKLRDQGGLSTIREGVADDIFLLCASYEPRTLAVAKSLGNGYQSKRGIIYTNKEFLDMPAGSITRSNFISLEKTLRGHCEVVSLAEGSWLDPRDQLTSLRNALLQGDYADLHENAITLDVTTFNRESLLAVMLLLRTHFPKSEIRILYASPKDHGRWLSRGFRCIRNVMGFSGLQHANWPSLLVVLSGFEPERTAKIIEEHEPRKVLLGVGDPPISQRFLQRNIVEQKLILARQDVADFRFPASNIRDCWMCLEGLLEPYLGKYNIILAPMSTKLSTLAVFLVAENHPEVQITYCVPGEYNTKEYSIGEDRILIDRMPYA